MKCPHCGHTITGKQMAKDLGSHGGKKSKRILTPEQARAMVEARELKKRQQSGIDRSSISGRTRSRCKP